MVNKLKELLERAQTWPEEAQEELVHAGLEIEEEYLHADPATAVDRRALRERAWQRIEAARSCVKDSEYDPQEDPAREEQKVADEITEMRRKRRRWLAR